MPLAVLAKNPTVKLVRAVSLIFIAAATMTIPAMQGVMPLDFVKDSI